MSEVSGSGNLGERKLTTIHAIGQSLAIGPMFSAGLLTGLVASVAGFSTPLAVLLGTIGAVCLGYVISLFARRYSGAGAMYESPGGSRHWSSSGSRSASTTSVCGSRCRVCWRSPRSR
jgi:amino acid transporter